MPPICLHLLPPAELQRLQATRADSRHSRLVRVKRAPRANLQQFSNTRRWHQKRPDCSGTCRLLQQSKIRTLVCISRTETKLTWINCKKLRSWAAKPPLEMQEVQPEIRKTTQIIDITDQYRSRNCCSSQSRSRTRLKQPYPLLLVLPI